MREVTQRRLARAAFMIFCMAPTVGVLVWAIAWSLPSHTARVERKLAQQVGLVVRIDRVSHPRPNVVRVDGLQFRDPETRELLGTIDWMQLSDKSRRRVIAAGHTRLAFEHRNRLAYLLYLRLVQQQTLTGRESSFTCAEVTGIAPSADATLYALKVRSESGGPSARANLTFATQAGDSPRVEVSLVRNRSQLPVSTEITLDAREQPIRLGLFSPASNARFGPTAAFRGTAWLSQNSNGWQSRVSGELTDVEFERVLPADVPHRIYGRGSLIVSKLTFSPRGIGEAVCQIRIGQGEFDSRLLKSLAHHRLLSAGGSLNLDRLPDQRFPFRDLAVELRLDSQGVTVRGLRSARPVGSVALGTNGAILLQPEYSQVPVDFLVTAIVPAGGEELARRIQQMLPRPSPFRRTSEGAR